MLLYDHKILFGPSDRAVRVNNPSMMLPVQWMKFTTSNDNNDKNNKKIRLRMMKHK